MISTPGFYPGGGFPTRGSGRSREPEEKVSGLIPGQQFIEKPTLMEYSSLREKGSTVLFLIPFLPFDKRLFLGAGVLVDG